jgi:hypothetical protein
MEGLLFARRVLTGAGFLGICLVKRTIVDVIITDYKTMDKERKRRKNKQV